MTPEIIAKAGTEFAHQCALFAQCALHMKIYPELRWFHSIQNEEKSSSPIVGSRSKASGKKAGVSDCFLPVKRERYSGIYIEMKKPGGKASKEQIEFGHFVTEQSFYFVVCYDWESAWKILLWYLNLI